jgi:EAL domain-containing protein (putative c-di-GMP-specific phosphodiesterase class I)
MATGGIGRRTTTSSERTGETDAPATTGAGSERARRGWEQRIRAVLSQPERLTLVAQPIVDLHAGQVAGYEVLSRFAGSPISPRYWFHAADRLGLGPALEAVVLDRALSLRRSLPDGRLLNVNATADHLATDDVAEVLELAGDLTGLILEFSGDAAVAPADLLAKLRSRGATLASAHADPSADFLRVDSSTVDDLGVTPGQTRGLLAERIESLAHLDASLRLGLPLGQGWLLGEPTAPWAELEPGLGDHIRRNARAIGEPAEVADLAERPCVLVDAGRATVERVLGGDPALREVVVLDGAGRLRDLYVRRGDAAAGPLAVRVADPMVVSGSTITPEVAGALGDDAAEPLVCVDLRGGFVGVVRRERLAAVAG